MTALEIAAFVALLVAAMGMAIYVLGRGIRRRRWGDRAAGLAILAALCVASMELGLHISNAGVLLLVFGVATMFLAKLAPANDKRNVQAVGFLLAAMGLATFVIL